MIRSVIFGGIVLLLLLSTVIPYGIIWALKRNLTFLELLKKYFYIPIATFFGSLLILILVYILLRLLLKPKEEADLLQDRDYILETEEKRQREDDLRSLTKLLLPYIKERKIHEAPASKVIIASMEIIHEAVSEIDNHLNESQRQFEKNEVLRDLVKLIKLKLPLLRRIDITDFVSNLNITKTLFYNNESKLIL